MFRQVKRWKNFLNFLPQMFNSSTIVALAGNCSYTQQLTKYFLKQKFNKNGKI